MTEGGKLDLEGIKARFHAAMDSGKPPFNVEMLCRDVAALLTALARAEERVNRMEDRAALEQARAEAAEARAEAAAQAERERIVKALMAYFREADIRDISESEILDAIRVSREQGERE